MSNFSSLLATLGLAALALAAPAAGQTPTPGPRTCGTAAADSRQQAALQRRLPGYDAAKRTSAAGLRTLRTAATTYTLPVVVHVIHNGEAVGTGTNISQAQVQSQLAVLNEDYRNLNTDGSKVPSAFQPLRADAQVQFVLATRDPSGQVLAEPGIDRVSGGARGFGSAPYADYYIDNTIKPATSWNPDQYVNIWVLALPGDELGYAQFPDNTARLGGLSTYGGAANTDGVVVTYTAFGRVGTLRNTYNLGRTLTHEMGHFLGLIHVWGDATCGNDYCADTPTQETGNFGCPSFPHVTCSNGPTGDMFMNYMDYVNDACMQLFSGNQKDRMQAVMAAGTPRRTSLLTSPALCNSLLSATASNSGAACLGSPVQLMASSAAGTAYNWYGPNGFTSTQQNPMLPSLTAGMAGIYTVLVSNGTGACPGSASTTVALGSTPAQPVLAASALAQCPGTPITLSAPNLVPGQLTYAWSLVSGDGLPATTNTPTLTVSPTQNSVYRLMVSGAGFTCPASDTVGVRLAAPVWSGAAGNGNWFDAANWASGCVPTRATNASIPAGLTTPYPTIGTGTAEVRTLTQQGSLTLAGGELALYGNYSGTGSLTQTGGTVATRGPSAQVLRPATYQTLLVAGTGPKIIGAATIGQALTLAGPVLATGTATLTLAPTARLTETETSYVLGQVQTTHTLATTADSFGGLGLTIEPASAPGATTVVRTTGQPQTVGTASSIARYFDIKAVASRGLLGATLTQQYQAHELNGLNEGQLAMFRSVDAGATWSNEGATQHDATAKTVARAYVTDLQGRWTLASAALPLATLAPTTYSLSAFPVPFGAEGLSVQVTTPTAGPLSIKLYDMLGRVLYDYPVATVQVGTSTVALPGAERLAPAKYVLVVQQGSQTTRLNVVRQ